MGFTSELVGTPVRRVVIELPQERATALADALDNEITWSRTPVEDELAELYAALRGEEL